MNSHLVEKFRRRPELRSNVFDGEEKTRRNEQLLVQHAIDLLRDQPVDVRNRRFESIQRAMNFADESVDVQAGPGDDVQTRFERPVHLFDLLVEQRIERRRNSPLQLVKTRQQIFEQRFVMFERLFLNSRTTFWREQIGESRRTFCMQRLAALGISTSNRLNHFTSSKMEKSSMFELIAI